MADADATSTLRELAAKAAADGALFRSMVAEGYDKCADAYLMENAEGDHDEMRLETMRELFESLPGGSHVLDVGCGAGLPIAKTIVEHPKQFRVTGVDISSRQIELAKEKVSSGRARFICSDMGATEFVDESFAAVIAFFSVFHLPRRDHADFFKRVAAWLRPRWALYLQPRRGVR